MTIGITEQSHRGLLDYNGLLIGCTVAFLFEVIVS